MGRRRGGQLPTQGASAGGCALVSGAWTGRPPGFRPGEAEGLPVHGGAGRAGARKRGCGPLRRIGRLGQGCSKPLDVGRRPSTGLAPLGAATPQAREVELRGRFSVPLPGVGQCGG